jgi:DNA-binding NarL/FixJ family response regulator
MRIILADKNQKTVWALITVIQEEPAMKLVGEAENSEELLQMAENATVDLILLDRKFAGDPIKSLISKLHAIEPRPIVLVMSSDAEDGRLMLNAGADAFISKGDRPDWLLDILRSYAKRIQKTGKPK